MKAAKPFAEQTFVGSLVFWLEKQRGQCGRERERVERRDQHRDGNGDRELLIQAAGDAGNERGRNEDRGKDQRDRDDGSAHLFHSLLGGGLGIHALFNMMFDGLDDNDGVIDDQPDGENQAEQRQRVDGEAERRKDDEGSDQRDRNGQQRNQGGAPSLKKDEDDEDDKSQTLQTA